MTTYLNWRFRKSTISFFTRMFLACQWYWWLHNDTLLLRQRLAQTLPPMGPGFDTVNSPLSSIDTQTYARSAMSFHPEVLHTSSALAQCCLTFEWEPVYSTWYNCWPELRMIRTAFKYLSHHHHNPTYLSDWSSNISIFWDLDNVWYSSCRTMFSLLKPIQKRLGRF